MKSINSIRAVMMKEMIDIMRNRKMLLIMFIFPIFYLVVSVIAKSEFQSDGASFILMHSILVPILTMSTIVAEEKEKGTLKLLMMSGVRTVEYFLGLSIIVMMFVIFGMMIFDFMGATEGFDSGDIVIITIMADVISLLIGSIIGRIADNQMSVGAFAVPVTLIIFFLPMIKLIKPEWTAVSEYFYSGILLEIMQTGTWSYKNLGMMFTNLVFVFILFMIIFNRKNILKNINR